MPHASEAFSCISVCVKQIIIFKRKRNIVSNKFYDVGIFFGKGASYSSGEKILCFCGMKRSITLFTKTSSIHSYLHRLLLHCNFYLPSMFRSQICGLLPWSFPTKIVYSFLFSYVHTTCLSHHIVPHLVTITVLCGELVLPSDWESTGHIHIRQRMKSWFSVVSLLFFLIRPRKIKDSELNGNKHFPNLIGETFWCLKL